MNFSHITFLDGEVQHVAHHDQAQLSDGRLGYAASRLATLRKALVTARNDPGLIYRDSSLRITLGVPERVLDLVEELRADFVRTSSAFFTISELDDASLSEKVTPLFVNFVLPHSGEVALEAAQHDPNRNDLNAFAAIIQGSDPLTLKALQNAETDEEIKAASRYYLSGAVAAIDAIWKERPCVATLMLPEVKEEHLRAAITFITYFGMAMLHEA